MNENAAPVKKRRFARFLVAGLATLLPTALTAYIVYFCYGFVHRGIGSPVAQLLAFIVGAPVRPDGERAISTLLSVAGDVVALVIVFLLTLLAGALTVSFLGRQVIRAMEDFFLKLPLIKLIYPNVKQVTDFFFTERKLEFRSVVAVPYPRLGLYSIGFVTGPSMRSVSQAAGEEMVRVFMPSSPTPITGYLIFARRRELVELPITVEEAFRLLVSCGVIAPDREAEQPPEGREDAPPQEPAPPDGPMWASR